MPPQNFSIPIPTKFCHKTYTCQLIFCTHHQFVQPNLYNKFFLTTKPPKFKPKFIQKHHMLHTLPNSMGHQHCPSYTMPKNSTIQKIPQSQDYYMINPMMSKISTRANNNKMTMSQHQTLNGT